MSRWVRVGKKRINIEYGIIAEEHDDAPDVRDLMPGGLKITIETGRVIVFAPGRDSESLLRAIDELIGPDGAAGAVGTVCDPATGDPLPREAV